MSKTTKLVAAITSIMAVHTAVYAAEILQIPEGTTGYAAVLKNGKVADVYPTYKQGIFPTVSNPSAVSYNAATLPADYSTLNLAGIANITFDKTVLFNAKVGDLINFKLFGQDVSVAFERTENHTNGDVTWIGKINDDSRAIITFGVDGTVIGRVDTDASSYSVEPAGDGNAWLIDNNAAGRSSPSLKGDGHIPAAAKTATGAFSHAAAKQVNALATKTANTALATGTTTPTNTVVDIMVLYSSTLPNAITRINYLVTVTNQAYIDSGLPNLSVRLVNAATLAYDDTIANSSALHDLTGNTKAFAGVNTNRTKYGADVVVYLRPLKAAAQGSCGVAWVNGANGSELSASAAYAVVSDGSDGRYFCYNTTLGHELGHVMGAVHDLAHSSSTGALPYAYGYGVPNLYGDIMSYYRPQISKFSSPSAIAINGVKSVLYLGLPDQADVVSTFKQTTPVVASFLPTIVK